jgi:excisionase family DNA binding protein
MSTKLPNTTDKSIQDLYSENPNLVTIQKAAQALKVSKDTLRRWEAKGKITSIRTTSGYRLYDLKTLSKTIKSKPHSEPVKPQFNPKSPIMLPVTAQTPLIAAKEDHHSFYEFTNLNPEIVKLPSQNTQAPVMPVKRVNDYSGFSRIQKSSKTASLNNLTPFKIYSVVALMIVFLSSLFALTSPYIPGINQTKPAKYISGLIQKTNKAIKPSQEVALTKSKPEVLAASSIAKEGKFLQLNLDTNVVGNLAVDGEGVFTENITAPNILYSLVAGNNISITGDAQNPTISSTVPLPGDATYTSKGIASFSSDFFTVSAGAVSIADSSITNTQIKDGTITNSDLANTSITINAGSGLSGGGTVALGGSIDISALGSTSAVNSITGTANQIIASASVGDITLSLPQDIALTSSPTFSGLKLSGATSGTQL